MNRTIKFRVWNPHSKSMTTKYHAIRCDGTLLSAASNEVYLESNIDETNEVLMQFTGLHDKNGKEIYEGDVLKRFEQDEKPEQVIWGDFNCQAWNEKDLEVIGNIYENPELIK